MQALPKRLQSIDVFRALTMFFMIFVNDVDGVAKIPEWIKHVSADTDGLGFADTIFPLFLFIVGLSIPFALRKRMKSGESRYKIAVHILLRSLALIVMGTFHVNLENYSQAALLSKPVFEIIITLSFFLIWLNYKNISKPLQHVLQICGVIILMVMAILYKGEIHGAVVGMRPQWWGILGLIGWGYLAAAMVFLLTGGKFRWQVIALIFFLTFNSVAHVFVKEFSAVPKYFPLLVGNGSMAAFITGGVVISLIYSEAGNRNTKLFFGLLILLGITFIGFGFLTRPIAGISKIHDTPAWVGICTGIGILLFGALVYLIDIKQKANMFRVIKPAGTSTLTCYLIPYLLYSFFMLIHFRYPPFFNEGAGGIFRSFVVSFFVVFVTAVLEKRNLRLKI